MTGWSETGTMPDMTTGGNYRYEMFMIMPDGKEFKSMELFPKKKM